MKPYTDIDTSKFYVIAVCSNPVRFNTRYRLFQQFQKHMKDVGAQLITVEQAFGDRTYALTSRDNKFDLQFRTTSELWHKENMINQAVQYLTQIDPDWKYVAWIDGDIHFQRPDIIAETAHQLQHYDIVQMFSHVINMGPDLSPIEQHNGFMWSYIQNDCNPPKGVGENGYNVKTKSFWHPGYAWAATREAMDKLPLMDRAVLGSGDHHMALGLIGCAKNSVPGAVTDAYSKYVLAWQDMAEHAIGRNVGYVPGMITHYWHGNKSNRKYQERWGIVTKNNFDPYTDISRDGQGLYKLNPHNGKRYQRLRDEIRQYFRQRSEDSLDMLD